MVTSTRFLVSSTNPNVRPIFWIKKKKLEKRWPCPFESPNISHFGTLVAFCLPLYFLLLRFFRLSFSASTAEGADGRPSDAGFGSGHDSRNSFLSCVSWLSQSGGLWSDASLAFFLDSLTILGMSWVAMLMSSRSSIWPSLATGPKLLCTTRLLLAG